MAREARVNHYDNYGDIYRIEGKPDFIQRQLQSFRDSQEDHSLELNIECHEEELREILVNLQRLKLSDRVISLDIHGNELMEFPQEINTLTNLQNLFASHNNLTELPGNLQNLTELKLLLAIQNPIYKIDPNDLVIQNLSTLHINSNMLTHSDRQKTLALLPNTDIMISPLQVTEITYSNYEETLSELLAKNYKLFRFKCLAFNDEQFNELINFLLRKNLLNGIIAFDLSHCPMLSTLPKHMPRLKNLQKLDIHHTKISAIPDELQSLTIPNTLVDIDELSSEQAKLHLETEYDDICYSRVKDNEYLVYFLDRENTMRSLPFSYLETKKCLVLSADPNESYAPEKDLELYSFNQLDTWIRKHTLKDLLSHFEVVDDIRIVSHPDFESNNRIIASQNDQQYEFEYDLEHNNIHPVDSNKKSLFSIEFNTLEEVRDYIKRA